MNEVDIIEHDGHLPEEAAASDLTASLEDYLEAIYWLCQEHGVARVNQIAKRLGVNMSSVTGALKHLSEKGYIAYDPYQFIRLNDRGEAAARDIVWRHEVLKRFLVEVLDVEEELAGDSACKIEHHMDRRVLGRLLRFVEFLDRKSKEGTDWPREFVRFLRSASAGQGRESDRKDED